MRVACERAVAASFKRHRDDVDIETMKRAAMGIAAVAASLATLAAAYAGGHLPGARGCVLRSVDEEQYVRRNEAVLRSLPLPLALRAAHVNTWTHAISAPNACLPFENGPPYSSFITTYVFARQDRPLGVDPNVLRGQWIPRSFGAGSERSYCNGPASLRVNVSDEALLLSVDHRGCADSH